MLIPTKVKFRQPLNLGLAHPVRLGVNAYGGFGLAHFAASDVYFPIQGTGQSPIEEKVLLAPQPVLKLPILFVKLYQVKVLIKPVNLVENGKEYLPGWQLSGFD